MAFSKVDEARVDQLARVLSSYIESNLPNAFERRKVLNDYRTNPYVLTTVANVMRLNEPARFADFLFNSKLYMTLETSFGKSIEAAFLGFYPIGGSAKWEEVPEKIKEFRVLDGLSREDRARKRTESVWREIDKSCITNSSRYLVSIKSGPNTINDTQVQAMTEAIINHHKDWANQTKHNHPSVKRLDVVIGLTYGTNRTTNNKENQILVKLLSHGFKEEDRDRKPGVLIDEETGFVRVYRTIGRDFWGFIGCPSKPDTAQFVFVEILLGLSRALSKGIRTRKIEMSINSKLKDLARALEKLQFPRSCLPKWVINDFTDDELFWFATGLTAFFDEGI